MSRDVHRGTQQYARGKIHGTSEVGSRRTVEADDAHPEGAHLRVRGEGQSEQCLKASVDPGEPEMHKVVETVLTPAHPDPFEPLLDEPFTGTFDHPRAQRQPQFLVLA